jgi:hypothetical protein
MKHMKDDLHHMVVFKEEDLDLMILAFKRGINTWSPPPKKLSQLIEELENVRLHL